MAAVPRFFATSTAAYSEADRVLGASPSWRVPAPMVDYVGDALDAAGNAASNVSDATKQNARILLLLVSHKREPEITIEETGEISFEWYRDKHHVAVLTVDDQNIRWAAVLDQNTPAISGAQTFGNFGFPHVPPDAMAAIDAAI